MLLGLTMVMRIIRPHEGKWNASKYEILITLIALNKPTTCGEIAYRSGIPPKSVRSDMWRYRQFNYVRRVGIGMHYKHRITVKGRWFIKTMTRLHLIDTNRIDKEMNSHWSELTNREGE